MQNAVGPVEIPVEPARRDLSTDEPEICNMIVARDVSAMYFRYKIMYGMQVGRLAHHHSTKPAKREAHMQYLPVPGIPQRPPLREG